MFSITWNHEISTRRSVTAAPHREGANQKAQRDPTNGSTTKFPPVQHRRLLLHNISGRLCFPFHLLVHSSILQVRSSPAPFHRAFTCQFEPNREFQTTAFVVWVSFSPPDFLAWKNIDSITMREIISLNGMSTSFIYSARRNWYILFNGRADMMVLYSRPGRLPDRQLLLGGKYHHPHWETNLR